MENRKLHSLEMLRHGIMQQFQHIAKLFKTQISTSAQINNGEERKGEDRWRESLTASHSSASLWNMQGNPMRCNDRRPESPNICLLQSSPSPESEPFIDAILGNTDHRVKAPSVQSVSYTTNLFHKLRFHSFESTAINQ